MSQSYPALCMQLWCHCTVVKYRNFRQNEDKHHEVNIMDILCHLIQDLVVLIFFFSYLSSSGVHKRPWGCVVGWTRLLFSLKNGPHLPRGSCLYGEALLYGEWCSAVVALGCWWCSVLWLVISTFILRCAFQLWYVLMCFQLLLCVRLRAGFTWWRGSSLVHVFVLCTVWYITWILIFLTSLLNFFSSLIACGSHTVSRWLWHLWKCGNSFIEMKHMLDLMLFN